MNYYREMPYEDEPDFPPYVQDLYAERDNLRERLRVLTEAARALADEVDAIPIQPANGVRVGWLRDKAATLRGVLDDVKAER